MEDLGKVCALGVPWRDRAHGGGAWAARAKPWGGQHWAQVVGSGEAGGATGLKQKPAVTY